MAAKTIYQLSKSLGRVVSDIREEMSRQIDQWGEQSHPDGTSFWYSSEAVSWQNTNGLAAENGELTWAGILLEEVYEALSETRDPQALRDELVQVAAVAGSWIKDIDSRREQ